MILPLEAGAAHGRVDWEGRINIEVAYRGVMGKGMVTAAGLDGMTCPGVCHVVINCQPVSRAWTTFHFTVMETV